MPSITFIQHKPGLGNRERELDNARARAHAARVSHQQRRSKEFPTTSRRLPRPQSTNEDIPGENPVVPTAFHGDSDPFGCFDLEITPELNRILTFTRDVGIQAHYMPLGIRILSHQSRTRDLERGSIISSWGDVASSLFDEGIALSRLTTYCQIMSTCVPDPKHILAISQSMQHRSLRLLLGKLQKQSNCSLSANKNNLKRHVFGLFDAELHRGNADIALIHGRAIRKLVDGDSTLDLPFLLRLLYMTTHRAASTGSRSLPYVSDWTAQKLEDYLSKTVTTPLLAVSPASHSLHANVIMPALRTAFARRRYLADLLSDDQGQHEPLNTLSTNLLPPSRDLVYIYIAISSLIDMTRLNNMYHDLLDAAASEPNARSQCQIFTQAALAVALYIITRWLYGDLTINGIDLRDFSAILKQQLRIALSGALDCSNMEDRAKFADAHLWALFVGAMVEHKRSRAGQPVRARMKAEAETLWCSIMLVRQARTVGAETWVHMRSIAQQFLYTDVVEPDGSEWFEDLFE